jgi:cell division protein FtsB
MKQPQMKKKFLLRIILVASAAVFLLGVLGWATNISKRAVNQDENVRQLTQVVTYLRKENDRLNTQIASEKQYRELLTAQASVTTTFENDKTLIINGKAWEFVHRCEGGPEISSGIFKCAWGNSRLSVISPEGKNVVLADTEASQSYLMGLKHIGSGRNQMILIAYGTYGELEGLNEMAGIGDYFNYTLRVNDLSVRKLTSYPTDLSFEEAKWNVAETAISYVPHFCHPGCVPVPVVVYDLASDRLLFTKETAYGSAYDKGYAIMPEKYEDAYWEKIEWIDTKTIRAVKHLGNGKQQTYSWKLDELQVRRTTGG